MAALVGTPIAGKIKKRRIYLFWQTDVIGFLRDLTGNFDLSFYVMGSIMTFSAAIRIPLKKIAAWEKMQKIRATSVAGGKDDAENAM